MEQTRTLFGNVAAQNVGAPLDRSTEVGPETMPVADTNETAETHAAVETSEQAHLEVGSGDPVAAAPSLDADGNVVNNDVSGAVDGAVDGAVAVGGVMPAHADVAALLRQRQEIDNQIESARHQAMAGALKQIHDLMVSHGITVKDIAKKAPKKVSGAAGGAAGTGSKVPPKYQDPLSGATWTGRGKRPKWYDPATAIKL